MSRSRGMVVWLGLAGWLLLPLLAGWFGAQFTATEYYQQLAKPQWAPPGWVFGPVWTVLYLMMGVAAWLIWKDQGFSGARTALVLFLAQLVLNAAWSWIFFGLREPGFALAEILGLWVLLLLTLAAFWAVNQVAGLLLVPYLLWVTYAAALNYSLWHLN